MKGAGNFFALTTNRFVLNIRVNEYKPETSLSPYIEWYWLGSFNDRGAGHLSWRVIPSGYVELIIHLTDLHCDLPSLQGWSQSPNYTIIGLQTKPYVVRFSNNVRVFGIRFKPEGIYKVFGVPASKFAEIYEDMSQVMGRGFRDFCDKLILQKSVPGMLKHTDRYLSGMARHHNQSLGYVDYAAELIRKSGGGVKIEELQNLIFIGLRQLEREFKEKIGMTPKKYLRISRLIQVHRLLESSKELNLTEIAYQTGYTDQAHFIRDYKSIIGETPSIYVKEKDRFIVNTKLMDHI